ncbi:substrate-binding periplasmic protein [Undibacterium squillarum]|uniref:ABC transporter substrate-binding protein n=1 Tax=Undibacterium squillarum TaxID=1131567 RepID=A0ABQ2XVG0_9BURK|nr:transporter substrate-binding domain-containing protein [Undibacterium squillarum]GGX33797.1 ABC transporter substrate-binding protein [Undibacterium squillarum]
MLLVSAWLPVVSAAEQKSTQWFVIYHSHPPLSFEDHGNRSGFVSDIVDAILAEAELDTQSQLMPLARAFQVLKTQKNTMLFPVTRLPEREALYEWLGPVAPRSIYLYKLRTRTDIQVSHIDEISKYRIGLVREMASTQNFLSTYHVPKDTLDYAPTPDSNFRKFLMNRNDLIVASEWTATYIMRSLGHSIRELEPVILLDQQHQYYIAISKNSDTKVIQRLRTAYDKLQKSGVLEKIRQKYTE